VRLNAEAVIDRLTKASSRAEDETANRRLRELADRAAIDPRASPALKPTANVSELLKMAC